MPEVNSGIFHLLMFSTTLILRNEVLIWTFIVCAGWEVLTFEKLIANKGMVNMIALRMQSYKTILYHWDALLYHSHIVFKVLKCFHTQTWDENKLNLAYQKQLNL